MGVIYVMQEKTLLNSELTSKERFKSGKVHLLVPSYKC